MPIDTKTERRIVAREIGRNLGVAVEHLKVGARLVGAGTVIVVGVGGLLAGFFGCYFGFVVSLQSELQSVNAEAIERGAATAKTHRALTADIAKLKLERDSAVDLAAKAEELRVRYATQLREKERVEQAPAASTVVAATPSVPLGGLAELRSDGGGTAVIVAASVELLDRARELRRLNDEVGMAKMLVDGEIGLLDNGTKVRVLKREGFLAPKIQVRVLDGPVYGHAVWVRDEHVQPQQ